MNSIRRNIADQLKSKLSLLESSSFLDNYLIINSSTQLRTKFQVLPQLSSFSSTPSATAPLYSACIFERLPVVMPKPPQWATDYAEWQYKLRAKRFKTLPKEFIDERQAAKEHGAGSKPEWEPVPLETAADLSGNRSTTRRRLDQRIFMVLQKGDSWEFPHVEISPGETTRTAAERALQHFLDSSTSNENIKPYFVGNAPAGHIELSNMGTIFFHRCQLIQGRPQLDKDGGSEWKEMVWCAKDELHEYFQDEPTLELLKKML